MRVLFKIQTQSQYGRKQQLKNLHFNPYKYPGLNLITFYENLSI